MNETKSPLFDYAKTALLIVDVENDFMPWGALPVPQADSIIPIIQRLFTLPFKVKVAVRDFHPIGHCSFASRWNRRAGESVVIHGIEQKLWPDHCVQNTWGAELAPGVADLCFDRKFNKGTDIDIDSYSAFFNAEKARSTGVDAYFREHEITTIVLLGLTLEYCVSSSVLHALDLGYKVYLVQDGIQAISKSSSLAQNTIDTIECRGGIFISSQSLNPFYAGAI